MKVCVAAKHIANGVEKDSHHCMIADAIKAAIPSAQYIQVDLQSIRFSDPKKKQRYTYLTPAAAQSALLRFDKGDKKIQPFDFSLTTPHTREMGWKGQRGPDAKRKSTTKKHKAQYAYLAANRARNQKDREFGLRKFVD